MSQDTSRLLFPHLPDIEAIFRRHPFALNTLEFASKTLWLAAAACGALLLLGITTELLCYKPRTKHAHDPLNALLQLCSPSQSSIWPSRYLNAAAEAYYSEDYTLYLDLDAFLSDIAAGQIGLRDAKHDLVDIAKGTCKKLRWTIKLQLARKSSRNITGCFYNPPATKLARLIVAPHPTPPLQEISGEWPSFTSTLLNESDSNACHPSHYYTLDNIPSSLLIPTIAYIYDALSPSQTCEIEFSIILKPDMITSVLDPFLVIPFTHDLAYLLKALTTTNKFEILGFQNTTRAHIHSLLRNKVEGESKGKARAEFSATEMKQRRTSELASLWEAMLFSGEDNDRDHDYAIRGLGMLAKYVVVAKKIK